jgi:hypothetical protein
MYPRGLNFLPAFKSRTVGSGRGVRKRRSGLLLFGFLDLDADFLADFLDVLETLSRPRARGFVSPVEFIDFDLQVFYFINQLLQIHSWTPFI